MTETRTITRFSTCSIDGEPLVTSFEVPMTEWLCMACGRRYSMFGTSSRSATPKLAARYGELRAKYLARERPAAASPVSEGERNNG